MTTTTNPGGIRFAFINPVSHLILSAITGLGSFLLVLDPDFIGQAWTYSCLMFIAVSYSATQAAAIYTNGGRLQRVLINPTVSATLTGNCLTLMIGSFLYIFPEDMVRLSGQSAEINYWMNYYLFLLNVGNIAMWTGARSGLAKLGAKWMQRSQFFRRTMRIHYHVRWPSIVALLAISAAARFELIRLGVFGYSASAEALGQTEGIRQYLTTAADAGKLALVVISLQYFRNPGPSSKSLWLIGVLLYEVFFGIVSGFKSAVVVPVLVVAACLYYIQGRIPLKWIGFVFGALFIAYALIEPFRVMRFQEIDYQSKSFASIVDTVFTSWQTAVVSRTQGSALENTVAHFVGTRNSVPIYSLGLKFQEQADEMPAGSPDFLGEIFLAPLLAVTPRALWPDKPQSTHGTWYAVVVMNSPNANTSVGMSPVTYLYFAGGIVAVFLGYFVFGICQGTFFHGLSAFGAGGAVMYLGLFAVLAGLDSVYYVYIISLIRLVPILLVLQRIIFRAPQRRTVGSAGRKTWEPGRRQMPA